MNNLKIEWTDDGVSKEYSRDEARVLMACPENIGTWWMPVAPGETNPPIIHMSPDGRIRDRSQWLTRLTSSVYRCIGCQACYPAPPQRWTVDSCPDCGRPLVSYPRVWVNTEREDVKHGVWLWRRMEPRAYLQRWDGSRWANSTCDKDANANNKMHEVTGHYTVDELLDGAGRERCHHCKGDGMVCSSCGGGLYGGKKDGSCYIEDDCPRCDGTGVEPEGDTDAQIDPYPHWYKCLVENCESVVLRVDQDDTVTPFDQAGETWDCQQNGEPSKDKWWKRISEQEAQELLDGAETYITRDSEKQARDQGVNNEETGCQLDCCLNPPKISMNDDAPELTDAMRDSIHNYMETMCMFDIRWSWMNKTTFVGCGIYDFRFELEFRRALIEDPVAELDALRDEVESRYPAPPCRSGAGRGGRGRVMVMVRDISDARANMYGMPPCPQCKGRHVVPHHDGIARCGDCEFSDRWEDGEDETTQDYGCGHSYDCHKATLTSTPVGEFWEHPCTECDCQDFTPEGELDGETWDQFLDTEGGE